MAKIKPTPQIQYVSMTFVYKNIEYKHTHDFGQEIEEGHANYMFVDGNYSCDCNRSLFIGTTCDFPELPCGESIQMKDFKVSRGIK